LAAASTAQRIQLRLVVDGDEGDLSAAALLDPQRRRSLFAHLALPFDSVAER